MTDLSYLLQLQNELQKKSYGAIPSELDEDTKIQFIKDMILAAEDELHEMLGEVPAWKPWVNRDKLRENGLPLINIEAYKNEWIDLFHFVMNLALVLDMSAEEIEERYVAKRTKNAKRQAEGYDGVTGKCPRCSRALDDVPPKYSKVLCGICELEDPR